MTALPAITHYMTDLQVSVTSCLHGHQFAQYLGHPHAPDGVSPLCPYCAALTIESLMIRQRRDQDTMRDSRDVSVLNKLRYEIATLKRKLAIASSMVDDLQEHLE